MTEQNKYNKSTKYNKRKQWKILEECSIFVWSIIQNSLGIFKKFYSRKELELLARQALKENELASGERAARYAVSYVQKYLGERVKSHNVPGKNTWYYLADNEMKRPWDEDWQRLYGGGSQWCWHWISIVFSDQLWF